MKKSTSFCVILIMLIVCSCLKEESSAIFPGTKATSDNDLSEMFSVSENDVKEFIQTVYKDVRIKNIEAFIYEDKPLLYLVNLEHGWKIVSADKRMPPILAYSDNGFLSKDLEQNPGVRYWLSSIKQTDSYLKRNCNISANKNTELWGLKLSSSKKNNTSASKSQAEVLWTKIKLSETITETTSQYYGPYVTTKWGQNEPWNNNFPIDYYAHTYLGRDDRYYTGCAAVALSQLLYYYHFKYGIPSGLYENISISSQTTGNPIGYIYNSIDTVSIYEMHINLSRSGYEPNSSRWASMKKHRDSTGISSYVSDLMLDVGCNENMSYSGIFGSGTSFRKAYDALSCYGLQGDSSGFQKTAVLQDLSAGKPIFIAGFKYDGSGHAWVLDGYYKRTITKRYAYKWMLGYNSQEGIGEPATEEEALEAAEANGFDKPEDPMFTEDVVHTYYDYYSMNWGWDGYSDGFYLISIPYIDSGLPENRYSNNMSIIYNITPQ